MEKKMDKKTGDRIRKLSEKYRDYTALNLSRMVQVPSYSGEEENVIKKTERTVYRGRFR